MDVPQLTLKDFEEIKFRVAETVWIWDTWKQLFFAAAPVEGELTKLDLMKRSAPAFFMVVRNAFFNEVVLRVCKQTDHPKKQWTDRETGVVHVKAKTLSLRLAVEEPPTGCTAERLAMARGRLADLLPEIKPLRDRRNWLISHDDLAVVQGIKEAPPIRDTLVDAAIDGIIEVCELLDPEATDTTFGYRNILGMHGDGDAVVSILRCAHRFHQEHLSDGGWRLD